MTTQTFTVTGMSCSHCVHAVTSEVSKLPEVSGVTVDLPTGTVIVTSGRTISSAEAAAAIDEAGYQVAS